MKCKFCDHDLLPGQCFYKNSCMHCGEEEDEVWVLIEDGVGEAILKLEEIRTPEAIFYAFMYEIDNPFNKRKEANA